MARVKVNQPQAILHAQRVAVPLVKRMLDQTLQGAKRLAPKGTHLSGSGKRRPGPSLQTSLKQTPLVVNSVTVGGSVGSTKPYAETIEKGSSAHIIRARGKMLKFKWDRGRLLVQARRTGRLRGPGPSRRLRPRGDFFFFEQVRHPGNKRPVRYLMTPLVMFGRINGFKVSSTPASRSRLP